MYCSEVYTYSLVFRDRLPALRDRVYCTYSKQSLLSDLVLAWKNRHYIYYITIECITDLHNGIECDKVILAHTGNYSSRDTSFFCKLSFCHLKVNQNVLCIEHNALSVANFSLSLTNIYHCSDHSASFFRWVTQLFTLFSTVRTRSFSLRARVLTASLSQPSPAR